VSRDDAFEDEMLFRALAERDIEDLMKGREVESLLKRRAPEAGELSEVAAVVQALRESLPQRPRQDPALVSKLARTARDSASAQDGTAKLPRAPRRRSVRPRLALAAKALVAIAALPLIAAGLAFADVTLPAPARDAIESVGIDLPNQPADEDASLPADNGSDQLVPPPASDSAKDHRAGRAKESAEADEKRGHGTAKENPARAGGRANGEQERGRALGKRGLAPGQIQPPGQLRAPGRLKQGDLGRNTKPLANPPKPSPGAATKQATPPSPKPDSGAAGAAEPAQPSKAD
jgi:hypothetical protein